MYAFINLKLGFWLGRAGFFLAWPLQEILSEGEESESEEVAEPSAEAEAKVKDTKEVSHVETQLAPDSVCSEPVQDPFVWISRSFGLE